MSPSPDIGSLRRLCPAQNDEEYRLHQAALEWSLIDPILIQSRDDVQSASHWQDCVRPFEHQVQNLITFCRRLPVTLLADDVGLGKTISAGLILSELTTRRRVRRALVVCPAILGPQWVEELRAKFGISACFVRGAEFNTTVRDASSSVVVTTYDTARDRLESLRPDTFDMLILDEAHKLKNLHGGKKPSQRATRFRAALERRLFRFVLMLTATPIQNRLWDIYSLVDCLCVARGHRNPLGSPDDFTARFVEHDSEGRRIKPGRGEEFRSVLRQYIVRTRRADCRLLFPDRRIETLAVPLSPQEDRLRRLVESLVEPLGALVWASLAQAMMSSPRAVAAQLENMTATRPDLRGTAAQARAIADACPEPAKLTRLLTLCRELSREQPDKWRVVVFTIRRETQELIGAALTRVGIAVGYVRGTKAGENRRAIEHFWQDPPAVRVLVSTDAGAEGVNLQVCNVLVNYDLPWNPMVVEQRIGRVQRLASSHKHVVVFNLVAAGTIEERVVGRLIERLQMITHTVGDIESILEAMNQEDDGFETMVRNMVIQAAQGQDVEHARRLQMESIDRAQQEYQQERALVDATLGTSDGAGDTGPRLPRLTRITPSVSAERFVLDALGAVGTVVPPGSGRDVYQRIVAGRLEEQFTFDERVADRYEAGATFGNPVRLYQPGRAHFERLVEQWVGRAGHLIRDRRPRTPADADRLARAWCERLEGAKFVSATVTDIDRQRRYQGAVTVRAQAYNGVDRYEKLLHRAFRPDGLLRVPDDHTSDDPPLRDDVNPDDILAGGPGFATRAAELDGDIAEFRRFYAERLAEEQSRAAGSFALRARVEQDFTVILRAEAAAITGLVFEEVTLRVQFDLGLAGHRARYELDLRCVPASGQLLSEPERVRCSVTGLTVPRPCVAIRDSTGQPVLRHLLAASGVSGRLGTADELERCGVTGTPALADELATCSVTGVRALRSLLVDCREYGGWVLEREAGRSDYCGRLAPHSLLFRSDQPPHRLGLPDERRVCSVTNQTLLPDEIGTSALSGRIARLDLLLVSEASGRLGLAEEVVQCEESGKRLLRDETQLCSITGRTVDARLLTWHGRTGQPALSRLMQHCASTSLLVFQNELSQCEITGLMVLPTELERCAVTGKLGMRSRMCQSALSGHYIAPGHEVRSAASGRIGLPTEAVRCEWLDSLVLRDELERCALTSLRVSETVLNADGQIADFALLLDGVSKHARATDWLLPKLQSLDSEFRRAIHVKAIESPNGQLLAVCVELRSGWLDRHTRYIGLVLRMAGGPEVLGQGVRGYRMPAEFVIEDFLEFDGHE